MQLDISATALAIYFYLMYIEDRKTYQCYPSYKTIGKALKIKSKGTVAKYVRELEDKCLIYIPPRCKNCRRDLFDFQPKSGTAVAYDYAVKKKKEIINVFKRCKNNV